MREVEAAGIPTVTLSFIPDFTAAAGAPRTVGIAFPSAQPLGPPGDADTQTKVLRATLDALVSMKEPGRVDLPFEWTGPRPRPPRKAPPIARACVKNPWNLVRLIRGDLPDYSSAR